MNTGSLASIVMDALVFEATSSVASAVKPKLAGVVQATLAAQAKRAAPLRTGSWFSEELARFERSTLRPAAETIKEAGYDIDRGLIRPAAKWVGENPCETMQAAMFLAFGMGDPRQVLAGCPPEQVARQEQRASGLKIALVIGGAALLAYLVL